MPSFYRPNDVWISSILYSFSLRRFRKGGDGPVFGHKPIFGRTFGHFSEIEK